MKIEKPKTGKAFIGRIPSLGITTFVRNGSIVTRVSTSNCKSNTHKQFVQRQRMRHSIALWKSLSLCRQLFTQGKTAYHNFLSLANQLPAVYLPKNLAGVQGSLLMPGIPVSDGSLGTLQLTLGEVNGVPALLTDRKIRLVQPHEAFLLYTAEQSSFAVDVPKVNFSAREVSRNEFTEVDGCLALVSEDFADETKGWALVSVIGPNCTTQTIVTHCKEYEKYTTEEAFRAAAQSYGGVK